MDLNDVLCKKNLLSYIARGYNSLQYAPQLISWLEAIYPGTTFSNYNKFELHQALNNALLQDYAGEFKYKYFLFKKFHQQRLIAGFEMKVKNSRIDFITVNGCSTSYEIKSTIDNLGKLSKQAGDYLSAFEYNNVIVDEKHLEKCVGILPVSFGIIIFKNQRQRIFRRPLLNTDISSETQLSLLTKKELFTYFQCIDQSTIISSNHKRLVNENFKLALKSRYQARWQFVKQHAHHILPIDLQFFFNTNIPPENIYGNCLNQIFQQQYPSQCSEYNAPSKCA